MNDNNGFLSNYANNLGPGTDSGPSYKYEDKSGFKKPSQKKDGLPPQRRAPRYVIPLIAGVAAIVIVVILLIVFLGGGIKVLDFKGWTLNDAQLWASKNGVLLKTDNEYNDTVENGKVISQDASEGSILKKGDFLTLTVSLGHDLSVTLPLPDFMSMTMDEVQKWSDDNFMTKVRITTEYSNTVPSGKVIRFTVNDNTVADKVRRDTPVYVIVSKGPEDQASIQVTVPDFKTMSITECYIFANDNGITLTVTEQYDDYVPKGSIISQSVKATQKVSKGSEIKLIVSLGKMITVPNFSKYTKEEAALVASSLGIPVTVIEKYSSRKEGALISQSIKADTVYETGQYLKLNYSLGNTVAIASYIGQTRDAIESWANELNSKGASITINTTYTQSSYAKGTIIYQDIANKIISIKTTINLTISSGITVPDFVDDTSPSGRGYETAITIEEAIRMCSDAGFVPVFITEASSGRLPNEVWFQDIPSGSEISAGSTITLKCNPGATYLVPDFTGKTKDIIKNEGYNAKFTIIYSGVDNGAVVGQSLAAGTDEDAGAEIILTLG